jgi:N-acetylglucosamine-6-sulfatase
MKLSRLGLIFAFTLALATSPGPLSHKSYGVEAPTNVIVIVTDDQTADSVPVMRKLLNYPESSWVRFTQAFANDSLCCPSRATILSGQYSHNHGVLNNASGAAFDDTTALPVWLDRAGYRTGLVGKYLNNYPWNKGTNYVPPGWDYFKSKNIVGTDAHTDLAVNFINSSATPWFLYLAYRDPHQPAKPASRYASAQVYIPPDPPNLNEVDVSDKPAWIKRQPLLSQTQLDSAKKERIAGQRALLAVDDGIQRVVETIKSTGQLSNTVVLFLSDNGFSFGSHRYINKHCVYEECSRIPLFVRYPGVVGNRDETRLVSTVDIASTVADLAGATPTVPQDGHSLVPVITNNAPDWSNEVLLEAHIASTRTFYAIRTPGWVYAEYQNGDKELYDLVADPYQLRNLANQAAYLTKQKELAQELQLLKAS